MKWYLPQILQCVVLGNSVVSSVGAKTLDDVSSVTEPVHNNVAGQLSGFDSMTSEALLLIVFILLVLAVIAHKPKAP